MKSAVVGMFVGAGISSYYWPTWGGFFLEPVAVSAGEGRIMTAIYFVGAALLWFVNEK
jgi:hypothetical protein